MDASETVAKVSEAQSDLEQDRDGVFAQGSPRAWQSSWPVKISVPGFSAGELVDRLTIASIKLMYCRDHRKESVEQEVMDLGWQLHRHVPSFNPSTLPEPLQFAATAGEVQPNDMLRVKFFKLFWSLWRSNHQQWKLEDDVSEVCWQLDHESLAEDSPITRQRLCRLGMLHRKVRGLNLARVELRKQINLLFHQAGSLMETRYSTDVRIYSSDPGTPTGQADTPEEANGAS